LLFDDQGHAQTVPDLAAEAISLRPVRETVRQQLQLLPKDLGWPTRTGVAAQGVGPPCVQRAHPLADRPFGHAQSLGNFSLTPTLLMQFQSPPAPGFLPVVWSD